MWIRAQIVVTDDAALINYTTSDIIDTTESTITWDPLYVILAGVSSNNIVYTGVSLEDILEGNPYYIGYDRNDDGIYDFS